MRSATIATRCAASLTYLADGAQLFGAALSQGEVRTLLGAFAGLPQDRAGLRLTGLAELAPLLAGSGEIGRIAASVIGPRAHPVRAVLFDKSAENNWTLAWHQDRTVVVRERRPTDGYGPWSTKAGLQHVAPPFEVLSGMVTLRVHLDAVGPSNAPLLIAPGSHAAGMTPIADIPSVVARCGTFACLAEPGDVWLYATPILHASDAAAIPARRRVLQVDYAAADLAGGLEWLGV